MDDKSQSNSQRHEQNVRAEFHTTRWSLVLAAGDQVRVDHSDALESLCNLYWYPLYAYARRQGASEGDAQDSVQSFFAYLLEKNIVAVAEQQRGRFRTFLLTSFSNYLKNEFAGKNALKRGGGKKVLAINFGEAETRFEAEPVSAETPEDHFARQWALTLLAEVMNELRSHYQASGKELVFTLLSPCLVQQEQAMSYGQLASQLGMTVPNVKTSVHRMRKRFGVALREAIAQTVQDESMVEDEINELFKALRRQQ